MQQPYAPRSSIYIPKAKDVETRPHAGSLPETRALKRISKGDTNQPRPAEEIPDPTMRARATTEKANQEVPIPKGNTAYAKAKRAEYLEKNLAKAEKYYRIAIKNGERFESAIKDLATVLHQQGKTDEACRFLEENRNLCKRNRAKYDNLLMNLKKQIVPSGNFLNRTLVLFNVPTMTDIEDVKQYFSNSSRVTESEFLFDEEVLALANSNPSEAPEITVKKAALLHFGSNSAARKTLETLIDPETTVFYWMNINKELVGRAEFFKKKEEETIEHSGDEMEGMDEMGTAETSSLGGSFSIHGSIGSPTLYLDEQFYRATTDSTKDNGLYTPSRTRKSVSPSHSPCWRSCVVLFSDSPTSKDSTISSKFEEYKNTDSPDRRRAESHKTPLTKYTKQTSEPLPELGSGFKDSASKRRNNSLWAQVRYKQKEALSIINDDPDYVGKLLNKVISENEQQQTTNETHSWSTGNFVNQRVGKGTEEIFC